MGCFLKILFINVTAFSQQRNIEHFNYSSDMHFKSATISMLLSCWLLYMSCSFWCFHVSSLKVTFSIFFHQTPWTRLDDNEWVMRQFHLCVHALLDSSLRPESMTPPSNRNEWLLKFKFERKNQLCLDNEKHLKSFL